MDRLWNPASLIVQSHFSRSPRGHWPGLADHPPRAKVPSCARGIPRHDVPSRFRRFLFRELHCSLGPTMSERTSRHAEASRRLCEVERSNPGGCLPRRVIPCEFEADPKAWPRSFVIACVPTRTTRNRDGLAARISPGSKKKYTPSFGHELRPRHSPSVRSPPDLRVRSSNIE